jgi:hypothetical protein
LTKSYTLSHPSCGSDCNFFAGADQAAATVTGHPAVSNSCTPAARAPAGGKVREPIRALKLAEAARIRDQQLQAEREAKRRKIKAEMEQRSAARAATANVKPFDVAVKAKGLENGVISSYTVFVT